MTVEVERKPLASTATAAVVSAVVTGVASGVVVLLAFPLLLASAFGGLPSLALASVAIFTALWLAAGLTDLLVTGRRRWAARGAFVASVAVLGVAAVLVGAQASVVHGPALLLAATGVAVGLTGGTTLLLSGLSAPIIAGLVVVALTIALGIVSVATTRSQSASEAATARLGASQQPWTVDAEGYHWLNVQVRSNAEEGSAGVIEMVYRSDERDDAEAEYPDDLIVRARALDDSWWAGPGSVPLPVFESFCEEPYDIQVVLSCEDRGAIWVQVGDHSHTVARVEGVPGASSDAEESTLVALTSGVDVDLDLLLRLIAGASPLSESEHAHLVEWSTGGRPDRPAF